MGQHHILNQLEALHLQGMAQAYSRQLEMPDIEHLTFDERIGLMVEHEAAQRADTQLAGRLRRAALRQNASMADIDFRRSRGLSKSAVMALLSCDWITQHRNILITGATGVGKSFLACAIAHGACLNGYSARYIRLSRILDELRLARADGTFLKLLRKLSRTDVIVLDDWGIVRLDHQQQTDILELLDDRHQLRSTIITSQLPVDTWHQSMADPTLADAILDRLIHNAYSFNLTGDSMRKKTSDNADSDHFRK